RNINNLDPGYFSRRLEKFQDDRKQVLPSKPMLIGKAAPEDVNLHPIKYQWAYDLYQQAVRNTWFPHEIALKEDLYDWEKMTEDERHAVKFLMAFFNPAELIVNRSIALGIYPYLKA